jgi:hypothetical protein
MFQTRSGPANICWSFTMPDFSLVPVDHQPAFSDVSLIPVDHDPFSADGANQQVQAQPGQTQPTQIQTPATGAAQPGVGALANNAQAPESGESWNPDSDQPTTPSAAPTLPPDKVAFEPFGELKPATYTPTQRIGNLAADALMGLGMKPYFANDLASRVGSLLGITPLGVLGSALDLIDAKRRDDLPGVLTAAAGMIPGAKGVVRGVVADAIDRHHPWPKYLGGAVKQELVRLPKSLHIEFHKGLDEHLPRWEGKAYYESLGPTERQENLQYLATYTKDFDAKHGTKLYDALLKNGFPAP